VTLGNREILFKFYSTQYLERNIR